MVKLGNGEPFERTAEAADEIDLKYSIPVLPPRGCPGLFA